MSEKLTVELYVGREGRASTWRHYLPTGSQATECLLEPVTIALKGPVHEGLPPECSPDRIRVFVGEKQAWQGTSQILCAFGLLWPEIIHTIVELTPDAVMLIYYSGLATHVDLFSLWPSLPFGTADEVRFHVSEIHKVSRNSGPGRVWFSVEYAREGFKRLAAMTAQECAYGTTIMGVAVAESAVSKYLARDPLDRAALEDSLRSPDVRCWWLCDADFEGMTVWHKEYKGDELAKHLEPVLRTPNQGHL